MYITVSWSMRTTVTLDDDIHEAALSQARATGQRLGKVLSDMARCALEHEPTERGRGRRFAAFEVPPDTPIIPSSRVQAALDRDGIV